MDTITIVLTVAEILVSVALIVVILMQSKNASGLTGALGGMGQTNTYWDKNKGRSLEGKLTKYTKILAALFIIIGLAISFMTSTGLNSGVTDDSANSDTGIEIVTDDADSADSADNATAPELEVVPNDGADTTNVQADVDSANASEAQ